MSSETDDECPNCGGPTEGGLCADCRSDADVKADESGTVTPAYRWQYLSSVVTLLVVVGYSLLVLATLLGPTVGLETARVGGGTWATYSLAFIAVIAYSVGVDTIRAAQEARSGGTE